MFVTPPNSYVEILTLKVKIFGGVVFGRCLGHEGEALMNGMTALIKQASERSLGPPAL